ncbi:hypothetical protein ILYODFUR_024452 [Ilyodon furcidens]|uniref:Uncharacterized protein n=1 Tax=Ilyodon furcidens TaxID=33524 RepID=A0ABV0U843_9TELE
MRILWGFKSGQIVDHLSTVSIMVIKAGINSLGSVAGYQALDHSGPTPANDIALQVITDCGSIALDLEQLRLCASQLFFQTLDIVFQIKCKIYFDLKCNYLVQSLAALSC